MVHIAAVQATAIVLERVDERLERARVKLKFYEAGMDLGWSANPAEPAFAR